MQGFKNFWIGIIDFQRMENRKDYWLAMLFNAIICTTLVILGLFIRIIVPYIAIAYAVVSILPTVSMTVRRLHDTDESGFYMFYILIFKTYSNIIILSFLGVWLCTKFI